MTASELEFLATLEKVIAERRNTGPKDSYTAQLFSAGSKRIAQKVGEEAIEVALAATSNDRAETLNEAADLIYHLLVLLADQDIKLSDVVTILRNRHQA